VKRKLGFCGSALIVVILAAGGFWYWINIPPQITIPTPVMPNPNGYDYFRRAGEAFELDDNGVDKITDPDFYLGKIKQYPLAAKEAWLKKNAKAFHLLREGLKYPALRKPVRSYFYIDFPEYAQYRELARALAVESHAHAARGDWSGAVRSGIDGYQFGNKIANGGPLVAGLMGVAIQAISLRELKNLVPHTDASTAKTAAARLEKIYQQRYPYAKMVQEEKWLNIGANVELMREPSWRLDRVRSVRVMKDVSFSWVKSVQMFLISKRSLLNNWITAMDALIENAHRPYGKTQPVSASGDPFVDSTISSLEKARWNWARNDTYAAEIMTMYTLHAYQLEHGHYPKNLPSLVPAYLHKIPTDPFEGTKPLQYKLQGNQYLLWSIGPDGVDNHGTPLTNPDPKKRRYSFTSPDSKGDVVAGVNMP